MSSISPGLGVKSSSLWQKHWHSLPISLSLHYNSSRLCSPLCVLWYQGRKFLWVASGPSQWRLIEHRTEEEGDLPLGQSCIDAVCHHRLEHVNAYPPPAPPPESRHCRRERQADCQGFDTTALLRAVLTAQAPPTHRPDPPCFPLHPLLSNTCPQPNLPNALLSEHWCNGQ